MFKTLRYFFTLAILTASALSTQAQDCGCDHVINPPQDRATSLILDGEIMGVKPGETVCLSAGFYIQIRFLRMSGEPGNPVVIKNCGGLVEIGDAVTFGRWYAIDLAFFKLRSTNGIRNTWIALRNQTRKKWRQLSQDRSKH